IKANKSKPFFMYMNHFMPHTPIGASLLFVGTSTIGIYGDAVHEVDWSVGQIIKTLREEGIENNTLIIFTSDNGPAASGSGSAYPLRGGKFDALEGGQRVPCVMQWPAKIPAGTVCRQIASAIDFLPTIAAFTGATLPNDRVIDGKNMYSLMTGVPGAISSYDTCGFFYNDSNFRPIRRGKWKYSLVWADKRLYDLTDTNPEVINRSKTYPALCAELDSMSKAHWKDMLETNYRPLGNTDSMKVSSERSITGNYTRQNRVTDSYYYTVHGRRIPVAQINSAPNGIYMIRTANGVKRKIILR
ncbi:MAG: sulfatase-like hydrolase/transferase, partial [Fibrobacteres bacterium]|nr:sulfatase-like hydrolase/transferase [Fibrobacterota bacterium]